MTPPPPASPPTVITPSGGVIIGTTHAEQAPHRRAVDAFYALPYACVPQRFRAATPLSPLSFSRFEARRRGTGRQPAYGAVVSEAAEKVLTLNIFRSSAAAAAAGTKKMPVVVYVHGGGFNFGEPLERDHVSFVGCGGRDIVLVSICYRLGMLGFTPPGEGREANLGLKDQRLALEWVSQYVDLFGGDAEDVTFMGVSAGAHSIGHHLLDPRGTAPRLFRRAILESGAPTARSVLAASHPRTRAQLDSLKSYVPAGETLDTLGVEAVLEANVQVWVENGDAVTWPFQPVVEEEDLDNAVIPAPPQQLWTQFKERMAAEPDGGGLAVLVGFCSHEGTNFVPGRAATNTEFRTFFATLIPGFSSADLDALEILYPDPVTDATSPYRNDKVAGRGKGAQYTRLHEAYAHYAYICPVLHTAHMLSSIGVRVYVYEYAALAGGRPPAAGHGDQASVVARDPVQLCNRPGLGKVAEAMHARWTAFAAGGSMEGWPVFETPFGDEEEEGQGRMLVFGRGNRERVRGGAGEEGVPLLERTLTERERRQCEFWWERMGLSQGMGERV